MSTDAVLEQIHALPPEDRETLFDALWAESREAWLRRLREDEEDTRVADEALRGWDGKTTYRLEDFMHPPPQRKRHAASA
jgi:hypothetical protein